MAKKVATRKKTVGRKKGDPKIGGRKKGTPNREYDYAEATACKVCGSAERSKYHKKRVWVLPPNDPDRKRGFTHRIERSTRCSVCGRWRWEAFLEYNPDQRAGTFDCTESDQDSPS